MQTERMPDHILIWTQTHGHLPHDSEIDQTIQAVQRIRDESELGEYWQDSGDQASGAWRREIDDLIERLQRSGGGDPASLSP